jgi:hypothetical protein
MYLVLNKVVIEKSVFILLINKGRNYSTLSAFLFIIFYSRTGYFFYINTVVQYVNRLGQKRHHELCKIFRGGVPVKFCLYSFH